MSPLLKTLLLLENDNIEEGFTLFLKLIAYLCKTFVHMYVLSILIIFGLIQVGTSTQLASFQAQNVHKFVLCIGVCGSICYQDDLHILVWLYSVFCKQRKFWELVRESNCIKQGQEEEKGISKSFHVLHPLDKKYLLWVKNIYHGLKSHFTIYFLIKKNN